MDPTDFAQIGAARLRATGAPNHEIAPLVARALPLLQALDAIADLDPVLPEPALTWHSEPGPAR